MRASLGIAGATGLAATPALAATGPFFSLGNTNFVVLIAFVIFVGVLIYYKVPRLVLGLLDKRAEGIRSDLAEARELREEAQTLLASYERKQKDVREQADRIVATAREEARAQARKSHEDLEQSVERRLQGAKEQIAQAEANAVKEIRDRAIQVATAAAADVLRRQMQGERAGRLIDESISTIESKLH